MPDRLEHIVNKLLEVLQTAESRHREAFDNAVNNDDLINAVHESEMTLRITSCYKTIELLFAEISGTDAINDEDINESFFNDVLPAIIQAANTQNSYDDQNRTITLHAKRSGVAENIVDVSADLIPILTLVNGEVTIYARVVNDVDGEKVAFSAMINGTLGKESVFSTIQLEAFSKYRNMANMHSITVHSSIAQNDTVSFLAWIEYPEEITQTKSSESVNLTTNVTPTEITLLNKAYKISSWSDVFVKVCEIMLLHRPYAMAVMDSDMELNTEYCTSFSYIESEIRQNRKRLSSGMWIEADQNSEDVLSICRKLLEKCGYSPDELQVGTMEVST